MRVSTVVGTSLLFLASVSAAPLNKEPATLKEVTVNTQNVRLGSRTGGWATRLLDMATAFMDDQADVEDEQVHEEKNVGSCDSSCDGRYALLHPCWLAACRC